MTSPRSRIQKKTAVLISHFQNILWRRRSDPASAHIGRIYFLK